MFPVINLFEMMTLKKLKVSSATVDYGALSVTECFRPVV